MIDPLRDLSADELERVSGGGMAGAGGGVGAVGAGVSSMLTGKGDVGCVTLGTSTAFPGLWRRIYCPLRQ
jgi:hypothetical protein